jgi:hypothetical protein
MPFNNVSSSGIVNNVTASFIQATLNVTQNANVAQDDHVKFDLVQQSFGSDITLDTSTSYTSAVNVASVGRFTLRGGKTYRLSGTSGTILGTNGYFVLGWHNVNTNTEINARAGRQFVYSAQASLQNAFSPSAADTIFSPAVDTRVELRIYSNSGITTIAANDTNGNACAIIQVVADNPPVTGQSIDFIAAKLTANTVISPNTDMSWNLTQGNIAYSSPNFTLLAGKSYELEASLVVSASAAGFVVYQWVDSSNNPVGTVNVQGMAVMPTEASSTSISNTIAKATFTPVVNTNVKIRVGAMGGSGSPTSVNIHAGSSTQGGSYAIIKQAGSTATISNPLYYNRRHYAGSAQSMSAGVETNLTFDTDTVSRGSGGSWSGSTWTASKNMLARVKVSSYMGWSTGTVSANILKLTRSGTSIARQASDSWVAGTGTFNQIETICEITSGQTLNATTFINGVTSPNIQPGLDATYIEIQELPVNTIS